MLLFEDIMFKLLTLNTIECIEGLVCSDRSFNFQVDLPGSIFDVDSKFIMAE